MRHLNPKRNNFGRRVNYPNRPYQRPYTYTRATKDRRYVKVLEYVAKHPGCKRFDIICDVWGYDKNRVTPALVRGQASLTFANLLYDDFIDYNNNYEYRLTSRGQNLLLTTGVL